MGTHANCGHGGYGRQSGAAAVEFALVAMMFFTLLFGIVEMGRFMYLYNTVQEVTRRAAREAVVSWTDQIGTIQRNAVFQGGTTGTVTLPAGMEVSNTRVNIRYLNLDRDEISGSDLPDSPADNINACTDQADNCIAYVQAEICEQTEHGEEHGDCTPVTYQPMVGLFSYFGVDIPFSRVVMPAESMGYVP